MTYSLGATGRRADHNVFTTTDTLKVSDTAGLTGTQQAAMRNGTPILCKGPDGAERYYVIDAERSLPGALVMKRM